jgi:subtilisin-like proprotein convertase family protein
MKTVVLIVLTCSLIGGGGVYAQGSFDFPVDEVVPDADANGVALTGEVSGLAGTIIDLSVSLSITNGFNGDLYAYLTGPGGGFAVLLNRVGVSDSASAAGYGDSGLDVGFVSGGEDIHYYQNSDPVFNGAGQLTGDWAADGRDIDPASAPSLFGSTAPSALLNSFNGTDPNGTWVLFLADFSNGGISTVKNWGLEITVPEPSSVSLFTAGFALMAWFTHRRRHSAQPK